MKGLGSPAPGRADGSGHRGLRGSGGGFALEAAPAGRPLERPGEAVGPGAGGIAPGARAAGGRVVSPGPGRRGPGPSRLGDAERTGGGRRARAAAWASGRGKRT